MSDTVILPFRTNARGYVLLAARDSGTRAILQALLRLEGYSLLSEDLSNLELHTMIKDNQWEDLVDMILVDEPDAQPNDIPGELRSAGINIPIIAVSPLNAPQAFLDAGYADYVRKPIDWQCLSKTLEKYASISAADRNRTTS